MFKPETILKEELSPCSPYSQRPREITDSIVLNAINENLEEGLNEVDIERTHRVGKPKHSKKEYWSTGISITESLIAKHMEMLNNAKKRFSLNFL